MRTVLIFFALVLSGCRSGGQGWDIRCVTGPGVFSLLSPSLAIRNIHTEVYIGEAETTSIRLADLHGLNISSSSFSDNLGRGTERTMSGTDDSGRTLTVVVKDYRKKFFVVEASFVNSTPSPVTIEGFSIGISGSSSSWIAGSELAQGALTNGYQSWSPSLISTIDSAGGSAEYTFENTGNDGDLLSMDVKTSWWYSAVSFPHAVLVSGALTTDRWKTKVLTYAGTKGLVWRVVTGRTGVPGRPARDRKNVGPGEFVSSERVFVGIYQEPLEGLEEYARSAAAVNPPTPPPFVPVGWNSWNTFFSDISETTVLANAQFIKDHFPGHGFNNIQIDDGWEIMWGEWETDTTKFPSGMDGTALSLTSMGFIPGIWMAPFLVDPGAPITTHTDWFLKDDDGVLLTAEEVGTKHYILDSTHPDAREWILQQIHTLLDWGYRYLKLDFLFAGAYEGKRHREGTTSMEAYREIMGAIVNEARSRGAYVLACGAPIFPTAGVSHGIRTGGDIAVPGLPYYWAFIKNESRNTSLRYFVNALYAGDPDTALLRNVPLEEARVNITAALLSGKIFSLGDDLPSLPPERITLIGRMKDFPVFRYLKVPGPWAFFPRPIDLPDLFRSPSAPLDSVLTLTALPSRYTVPEVWALRVSSQVMVGLFNWSDTEHRIGVSLRDMGLIDGPYQAVELWSSRPLGNVSERVEVLQPAHSVSLILISSAGGDYSE